MFDTIETLGQVDAKRLQMGQACLIPSGLMRRPKRSALWRPRPSINLITGPLGCCRSAGPAILPRLTHSQLAHWFSLCTLVPTMQRPFLLACLTASTLLLGSPVLAGGDGSAGGQFWFQPCRWFFADAHRHL